MLSGGTKSFDAPDALEKGMEGTYEQGLLYNGKGFPL